MNYFPNETVVASQLLTRFMLAHGQAVWDDDQSECEIVQTANSLQRRLGLSFEEARDLVIHTVLSDKGPAAVIPVAACMSDDERPAVSLKVHAPAV